MASLGFGRIGRPAIARTSSASAEEAKRRALDLFRETCRALPQIIDRYNLYEVITRAELRSKISLKFRKHADATNSKVIDLLVFKGEEELKNCLDQSKQRHHILSQYVVGSEGMVQPNKLGIIDHGESDFLKKFYHSNMS